METLADLMDRAPTPDNDGDSEAGKAIFQQMAAAARPQVEQVKQAKDARQATRKGARNDNR